MELHQYLAIMKERWGTAALAAVLVLVVVAALTVTRTPIYTATTRVFVQTEAGGSVAERNSGVDFASQQIVTYADLTTTPLVLEPVIDELDLDLTSQDLASRISTEIPEDTLIIEVTAWSGDPRVAAELADAVSESLRDQVAVLEAPSPAAAVESDAETDAEVEESSSTVELTVVSPATVPETASSPNIPRDLAIGLALALLAAIAAAVVRDLLDDRVRRPADIESLFNRPVVGTIPSTRVPQDLPLIAAHQPQSIQAEAYRDLRTNLLFMLRTGGMNTIMVTSSILAEGKSTSAINLAQSLAEARHRVLLVDADLRRPALATQLGLENTVGLTTVLDGEAGLLDASQPLDTEGLHVLTSGPIPTNPSELLGGAEMRTLLEAAATAYDYVVVDTAPLLAVTDAAALSGSVDGALVVAQFGRVKKQQVEAALAKLDAVDAHVLGVIVNRAPGGSGEAYIYTVDEEAPDASPSQSTAADETPGPLDPDLAEPHPRRWEVLPPAASPRLSVRRPAASGGPSHRARRDAQEQQASPTAPGTEHPADTSR